MTLLRKSDEIALDLINHKLNALWRYTFHVNKWYQGFAGYDGALWDQATARDGTCDRMESKEQMIKLVNEMDLFAEMEDQMWEYVEPKPLSECVHEWIIEGADVERWGIKDEGEGYYSIQRIRNGSQSPGECRWCGGTWLFRNTYKELETEIDDTGSYRIVPKERVMP